MRFSELDAAVEQERLHGQREWTQHAGDSFSFEFRTRDTKDTWRFPNDIRITLYLDGEPEWWTWSQLVEKAGELAFNTRAQKALYQSCVLIWNDADLEEVLTLTASSTRANEWERLLRYLQGMALCEERRYGDRGLTVVKKDGQRVVQPMMSNGWWTPFHLMRCIALGSDPSHVAQVASAMKGEEDPETGEVLVKARPIVAADCVSCTGGEDETAVCREAERPWYRRSGRRVLRQFYGDERNRVRSRFTLESGVMAERQ